MNASPPDENLPQPEDNEPSSRTSDDVDVPIEVLVKNMVKKEAPKGYVILPDGGIEANTAAENQNARDLRRQRRQQSRIW